MGISNRIQIHQINCLTCLAITGVPVLLFNQREKKKRLAQVSNVNGLCVWLSCFFENVLPSPPCTVSDLGEA